MIKHPIRISLQLCALSCAVTLISTCPPAIGTHNVQILFTTARDSVFSLLRAGRFTEAQNVAEETLRLLEEDGDTKAYMITDAKLLVSTMQAISRLPDSSKAQISRLEELRDEFDDLYESKKYVEAHLIGKELVALQQRLFGPEHIETANAVYNLAKALHKKGDYAPAEEFYNKTLSIQKKILGEVHPRVANTLNDFGLLKLDQGNYDAAKDLLKRALEIRTQLFGNKHPDIANNINDLGNLHWKSGSYAKAESLLKVAVAMQNELHGRKSLPLATSLNNLGLVLVTTGRYEEAEKLYRQSLKIRKEILGENDLLVANSLNNLAGLFWEKGNYATAEPLFDRALAIKKLKLGAHHPTIWVSLSNLGGVYWKQGEYADAEECIQQVIQLLRENFGSNNPNVALALNNLAAICQEEGSYEAADSLQEEALSILRNTIGTRHKLTATLLKNHAITLTRMGKYSSAEETIRDALQIFQTLLTNNHPLIANCLNNLSGIKMLKGEYSSAESTLYHTASIYKKIFSGRHPDYVRTLNMLGDALIHQGKYDEAKAILNESSEVFESTRRRVSSKQLTKAIYTAAESPYPLLALAQLKLDDKFSAWQSVERDRGRTLLEMLRTKAARRLTSLEFDQEQKFKDKLADLENALTLLASDTLASTSKIDSVQAAMLNVESQWLSFQNKIAKKYPITEGRSYSLEKIQSILDPEEAIIGWLDVQDEHFAYLLSSQGPVQWYSLPSTPLDSITDYYRKIISRSRSSIEQTKEVAIQIYKARFEPLQDTLQKFNHLYFICSGPMVGTPIETLIASDGSYIVEDYDAMCVPSASVLAWIRERPKPSSGLSLFALADPPFNDQQAKEMDLDLQEILSSSTRSLEGSNDILTQISRGKHSAIKKLNRLQNTRIEVQSISRLFGHSLILTGRKANEQSVVDLAKRGKLSQFRFIHLATHAIPDFRQWDNSFLVLSQVNMPDPFLRATSGERIMDGRLTVEEILREWKLDASLVTLSACETALGRKTRSEGYIGFAHALFLAGARCVLLSLWKVDDRATRMLMTRFYRNIIERGFSKSYSLREAKLWVRNYSSKIGARPYNHPFFWAGFILIGDGN